MRDVDVSPDGSHFVVATTGAYRAGSLCDTAARWETGAIGAGQQPTWADYTGGDTLYSVAVTGTAVYVGGRTRDPLPPGDLFRLGLDGAMTRSAFDGTTAGPPSPVAAGVDWSTVRGAFAVSGRLYTGHADGTMTVRTFDGAAAGPAIPIALNGLTSTQFPISHITGMFLWNGRLYYTLNGGDPRLDYHWFTPRAAPSAPTPSSPAAQATAATGRPSTA